MVCKICLKRLIIDEVGPAWSQESIRDALVLQLEFEISIDHEK